MQVVIQAFDPTIHLGELADGLLKLRRSGEPYPPSMDADETHESMEAWLQTDDTLGRWVALVGGKVVGQVQVAPPHSYIRKVLPKELSGEDFLEIAKFFVIPGSQSGGVGTALFERAREYIRAQLRMPILAVVESSADAIKFYERKGMRILLRFDGIHGVNLVFVDSQSTS